MSSRRRRKPAHTNHERWLVSYADFITLLFAFFVVLYASSQVDRRKAGKVAQAIQVAFQQMGAFPASTTNVPPGNKAMPFSTASIQDTKRNDLPAPESKSAEDTPQTSSGSVDANLSMLQTQLGDALGREIANREIAMRQTPEGLVISMREFGFFESGSGTLKSSALPTLDRIASLLAVRTYHMRIEGHTDNVPIHTSDFSSNWELSTARATDLVRLMITRYRLDPARLAAAGYAEYHPVAGNDKEQGRALNRRVDIVILK